MSEIDIEFDGTSKPSLPRVLVAGWSHVPAIAVAIQARGLKGFVTSNQWDILRHEKSCEPAVAALHAVLETFSPDVVCISDATSVFQLLGMVENPVPFAIGDADKGAIPHHDDGIARHFIPSDMMHIYIKRSAQRVRVLEDAYYSRYPKARFIHVAPPPPLRYVALSGADSPALAALRMKMYQMAKQQLEARVERFGALLIEAPQAAVDQDGFLLPTYGLPEDPTHGNEAYGQLVLDQILTAIGDMS